MIRAVNCILFIIVLLLTALFGLIALLILATEQPDTFLDKLYANSHREGIDKNETVFRWPPPRIKTTTMESLMKSSRKFEISTTLNGISTNGTVGVNKVRVPNKTTIVQTTTLPLLQPNNSSVEDFENSTTIELVQLPIKLDLSNGEKIMSIGMQDNHTFYVAKMNSGIEFFNWTTLESIQIEPLTIQVHRLGFLKDGRLVVTGTQLKELYLLNSDFEVIIQLKLAYQPLDLKIYNEMIYVLSRLDGTIFVYDSNLVQKFKIVWNKENSCNFIQPVQNFVYVSCDNAVVRLSNEGKILGRATISGALYSLAIFVPPNERELWSVQRGKQQIDVYDNELQFKYKLASKSEENAVWSAIGFGSGRVFALDYVSNTVNFFMINAH